MLATALPLLVAGFVSWWATGIDDVLALGLVLKGQPAPLRRAVIVGNVLGVIVILLLASLIVAGVLTFAPSVLDTPILGIPLQRLAGLLPILIGARALYMIVRGEDNDDDDIPPISARRVAWAGALGFQIYVLNSTDDLVVHLGILATVASAPLAIMAYWGGVLIGELTSILASHWLAERMQTRRLLEIIAAVVVIIVGMLVLLGLFEQLG
ncbi:MAG: hypothetical protein KF716_07710 [Anaerolineae bacterium]|nr:hypothetical protein [Anaerolineae bacterium]